MDIPDCLKHLPTHGNLPVPWFTAFIDGKPDFRIRDPRRNNEAVRYKLCAICGKYVTAPFVYVVGPLCLAARMVYGPAQHEECSRAALQLCPYLALEQRDRSERAGSENTIVPKDELPPKPPRLGLGFFHRYNYVEGPLGQLYSTLPEPRRVEWFVYRDGRLCPELP